MSGPATGRRKRATASGALLACLALIALDHTLALAQALTPDLFRPARDGFALPQDSSLRRTSDNSIDDARLRREQSATAPSRIGRIPTYGVPAASGASGSGFDALNRSRKKANLNPGHAKPKQRPLAGGPVLAGSNGRLSTPPSESAINRRSRRRWPAR